MNKETLEKEKAVSGVDCQDEENCPDVENPPRAEKLSELEVLKLSLEETKKQKDDYYDQLLRLQADFANFRRRCEEEKKKHLEWGKEKILAKQISMNDVLEQALKSAKNGGKIEDIIIGLDMVSKEFEKTLKEEGVEEIKLECFDPSLCEALEAVESEAEDGKILEVYQKGYEINGRLMRTAKVKVAKKKEEVKEEQQS
ncbi:MAG: nucleotide exchange factor GrpE [Elusimicrobiota bacterium]|nr:nucleotide exchange factor GrpE [Elusimicrobiota bacterium]